MLDSPRMEGEIKALQVLFVCRRLSFWIQEKLCFRLYNERILNQCKGDEERFREYYKNRSRDFLISFRR